MDKSLIGYTVMLVHVVDSFLFFKHLWLNTKSTLCIYTTKPATSTVDIDPQSVVKFCSCVYLALFT